MNRNRDLSNQIFVRSFQSKLHDHHSFYRKLIESSISEIGIRFYEVQLIDAFELFALNVSHQTCSSANAHDQQCITQEHSMRYGVKVRLTIASSKPPYTHLFFRDSSIKSRILEIALIFFLMFVHASVITLLKAKLVFLSDDNLTESLFDVYCGRFRGQFDFTI